MIEILPRPSQEKNSKFKILNSTNKNYKKQFQIIKKHLLAQEVSNNKG